MSLSLPLDTPFALVRANVWPETDQPELAFWEHGTWELVGCATAYYDDDEVTIVRRFKLTEVVE